MPKLSNWQSYSPINITISFKSFHFAVLEWDEELTEISAKKGEWTRTRDLEIIPVIMIPGEVPVKDIQNRDVSA